MMGLRRYSSLPITAAKVNQGFYGNLNKLEKNLNKLEIFRFLQNDAFIKEDDFLISVSGPALG